LNLPHSRRLQKILRKIFSRSRHKIVAMAYQCMMPRFFPVMIALSWALMSAFQTVDGAVSQGGGAPVADLPAPVSGAAHPHRTIGERLGLGDIDFPVSLRAFTLDLLAAEPPAWPDGPDTAAGESSESGKKAPAPMSLAMWFGVLGATLLILPRLRRR
jgi:hypothetical protein